MNNYLFVVEYVKSKFDNKPFKLLDYGCGAGEIVAIALQNGIEAFGTDVYYEGGDYLEAAANAGMLNSRLFKIDDGLIPFPDNFFDVVTSNQVFEHIDSFEKPLKEIQRVLKPNGIFINIFPDKHVWREGHIGIPFVHIMNKSNFRFLYTAFMRLMGFGYHKKRKSIYEWTKDALSWIDSWTYYKPYQEIVYSLNKYFVVSSEEHTYMIFRIKNTSLKNVTLLLDNLLAHAVMKYICIKLATRVFVLQNKKCMKSDVL